VEAGKGSALLKFAFKATCLPEKLLMLNFSKSCLIPLARLVPLIKKTSPMLPFSNKETSTNNVTELDIKHIL
jgi:hypothetical protein